MSNFTTHCTQCHSVFDLRMEPMSYDFGGCLCVNCQDAARERIIKDYRDFESRCFATKADKLFGDFINTLTGENNGLGATD